MQEWNPHYKFNSCTPLKNKLLCQILGCLGSNGFQLKRRFGTHGNHYEPKSPIGYDILIFVNFRFSKFFLAQIHPETSNLHGLCLKSLDFVIKFIISYVKLSSSHQFFSFELNLLNKKPEVKSKKNPKWPFSEIFGKSLLLGGLSSIQGIQKWHRLDRHR